MPVPDMQSVTFDPVTMNSVTPEMNSDPENQEEVMGTPGRVRDMIALFSKSPKSDENGNTSDIKEERLEPKSPKVVRSVQALKSPRIPRSSVMRSKITNWEQGIFSSESDNEENHQRDGQISPGETEIFSPVSERRNLFSNSQNSTPVSSRRNNETKSQRNIFLFDTPDKELNSEPTKNSSNSNMVSMTISLSPIATALDFITTNGYLEDIPDNCTNGSEPSLAGSRNGHRSASVMASKQSIISKDNVSPICHIGGSTEVNPDTCHQGDAMAPSGDSPTPSPRTPSYLRLSCVNSGYSKYSGYGSPRESTRIRVIKKSEQNSSLSSVGSTLSDNESKVAPANGDSNAHSDNQRTIINGGLDDTDSAKPQKHSGDHTHKPHSSQEDSAVNLLNSSDIKLDLATTTPLQPTRKDSLSVSPGKDGNYYIKLMEGTADRLRSLANQAEADLDKNLPEEASGKLRAAVGKVNLLITKKFKQFHGLCEQNLTQSEDEAFRTTCQDLAGFWDMVNLQVDDLDNVFQEIDKIRNNNWQMSPVHTKKPERLTANRVRSPRAKETPKSAKSAEMARQREEARRRLLEAKKKGRERKASQGKEDEIEIFVPQE